MESPAIARPEGVVHLQRLTEISRAEYPFDHDRNSAVVAVDGDPVVSVLLRADSHRGHASIAEDQVPGRTIHVEAVASGAGCLDLGANPLQDLTLELLLAQSEVRGVAYR